MKPTVTIDLEDYELYRKSHEVIQQEGEILYVSRNAYNAVLWIDIQTKDEVMKGFADEINALVVERRNLQNQVNKLQCELDKHTPKKWYQFWK